MIVKVQARYDIVAAEYDEFLKYSDDSSNSDAFTAFYG